MYDNTDDIALLCQKYNNQFSLPGYRQFRTAVPGIIGTWDDHDYCRNDGNETCPFKHLTQQEALYRDK